ncbi:MAG: 13E12 repeat family protein [Gemmatimonadales bacterium]
MIQFASLAADVRLVRETARVYVVPAPAPVRESPTDTDRIEEIEEEIVFLAAHLHAGEHRFLTLVAEFDRLRGWELGGHRSCAHWLAFRTGFDLGACRERVRAARALVKLPEISASMSRGELSFSKVRALSRVATAENESDLLDLARGCTAAQLERVVRGFKLGSRQDEVDRDKERFERRTFSVFPDEEGMYEVKGKLTPEIGVLLMRAVEAAVDSLYREKGPRNVSAENVFSRCGAPKGRRTGASGRASHGGRVRRERSGERHEGGAVPGAAACRLRDAEV